MNISKKMNTNSIRRAPFQSLDKRSFETFKLFSQNIPLGALHTDASVIMVGVLGLEDR